MSQRHPVRTLAALSALSGLLSGCAANQSSAERYIPAAIAESTPGNTGQAAKPDGTQTVYLTSFFDSDVIGFPSTAQGNVAPSVTIAGSKTQLNGPVGLAVDANTGTIYVANQNGTPKKILIFPKGSNGNVVPKVLAGSNVPLQLPGALAVDSSGKLYVADSTANAIYAFAAGATGNSAPIRTISGTATLLHSPMGVSFDSAGHVYVTNLRDSTAPIEEFAAGANGNVAPIATIGGSHTHLLGAYNASLDPSDRIVVANDDRIEVFAAGAHGNVAPVATIEGQATKITAAYTAGTNASGQIFVTNRNFANGAWTYDVLVFGSQANGNVHPLHSIAGSNTKLNDMWYPTFY